MTQTAAPFVLEQAVVTGTGPITLTGVAVSGFHSFNSTFTTGNVVPYIIVDSITGAYEYGQGTFSSAGNTLTRTLPQGYGGGATTLPWSFVGNLCNVYVGNPGPIAVSSGSSSMGRVPALNSAGQLDASFVAGIVAGTIYINYGTTGSISAPFIPMVSNILNPLGFGASGSQQTTYVTSAAAANSTSITVSSVIDFVVGQGIYISGAGASGTPLITTITSINSGTNVITFATPTSTAIAASATFNATFFGNYMTLTSTPSNPIYPGAYVTFGGNSFTICDLYSGTANTSGAVYSTNNSIVQSGTKACTAYNGVQHDDTAALNYALLAASASTGFCSVDCGGLQYNISSPVQLQNTTVFQNFSLLLAPGTSGNFVSIQQWQSWQTYSVGQQVSSNGNQYICTTAGTSAWATGNAGTGISGTGTGISDGTVVWNYVKAAVSPNAMLCSASNISNTFVNNGFIDINRVQNVFGFAAFGSAGIKVYGVTVRHWIGYSCGFYLGGKTTLYECSSQQFTSSDFEQNFPNLYFSGWNYFFDYTPFGGGGGGGTDSIAVDCTASAGGSKFFIAQGCTHVRLISCHPFPASGNIALTRSNLSNWAANTAYTVNTQVINGNYIYICTTAGTSVAAGDGPSGIGNGIVDGTVVWNYSSTLGSGAWAQSTAYSLGNVVSNFGQAYQATTAGTSASSGTGPFQNPLFPTYKATGCSVSGTTLTVPTANVASTTYTIPLAVNMVISGTGVTTGTYITAVGTVSGGNASYTLSNNLGTLTNVTISSQSVVDGTVVWNTAGAAPAIDPVGVELRGNSNLVIGTYLDTSKFLIYLFKPNSDANIITQTNSLSNASSAQLSEWIRVVAGSTGSSLRGLYISSDNNWTGSVPILTQTTVNGGSYTNLISGGTAQKLMSAEYSSVVTSRNGLCVYETNPGSAPVLQLISNYTDITSNSYSLLQFADPATTSNIPPQIGSNGNNFVVIINGVSQLTSSSTGTQINTVDINGGTIDGTVIGSATPAAGTFTNLSATSGGTFSAASGSVALSAGPSGNAMAVYNWGGNSTWINMPTTVSSGIGNGGIGSNPWVAYVGAAANFFTDSAIGDIIYRNTSGALRYGATSSHSQLQITSAAISFTTSTGTALGSITSTGLNSTAIGATTPSTGAFTTLSATSTVSGAGFTSLLSTYALITQLGAYTTTAQLNATTTLTTAALNKVYQIQSNITVTLPTGSSCAAGSTITFYGQNTAFTVATQGSDFIYNGISNVSSFTVPINSTLTLVARGNVEWDIVGGSALLQYQAVPIGTTTPAPLAATTISATNTITPSTTNGIVGTTLADNANTGSVGEYITASVNGTSAVSLTTATATNITSITLTAGDWDVWGTIATNPASTTLVTKIVGGISTTSATIPGISAGSLVTLQLSSGSIPANDPTILSSGIQRVNVSTTTTVYLVMNVVFTTSTCGGYGAIFARRVR